MAATQQSKDALKRANEIRVARGQLKKDVKDGVKTVCDILDNPPEEAMTMKIYDLLIAQHKWGRRRVLAILHRVPVAEGVRIEALLMRQADRICELIKEVG